MQISAAKQALWWGAAAAVLMLALWFLGGAIMPFILGMGIAYMLDPLADRLERMGLSRTLSVALITLAVLLALAAFLLWLGPLLVNQGAQLIETAPELLDRLQQAIRSRFPDLLPDGGLIESALQQIRQTLGASMGGLVGTLVGSLRSVVGIVMVLVIAPVVAFYMLLDWDHMVERVDNLLPRQHATTIRTIFAQIDDSVAGFLRGEALVILILGTFYSVALMLAGLPFGILIGVAAAVLSFIPYVGTLVGGALAIGIGIATFWGEPTRIGIVVAIFAAGQLMESNYLQPKIVGSHVGLHPVWLMLSLSVFGTLFGFLGLLVAVPVGAAVGVIVRFMAERYRESALYTGRDVLPQPAPPMLVEMVPPGTTEAAYRRSEAAHRIAAAEARVEDARFEARKAAEAAAKSDGARVAEATVRVTGEGAEAAAAALEDEPQLRSWGGRTPDGTNPNDPKGKEAARAAKDAAEAAARAAEEEAKHRSGPVIEGRPDDATRAVAAGTAMSDAPQTSARAAMARAAVSDAPPPVQAAPAARETVSAPSQATPAPGPRTEDTPRRPGDSPRRPEDTPRRPGDDRA